MKIVVKKVVSEIVIMLSALLVAPLAQAADSYWDAYWKLYSVNPREAVAQLPFHQHGKRSQRPFSDQAVAKREFLQAKDQSRQELCRQAGAGEYCQKARPFAEYFNNWELQEFLPKGATPWPDLETIDLHGGRTGRVALQPWSGDYWPTFVGGIAARYADPKFFRNSDWNKMEKIFKNYSRGNFSEQRFLDNLSPAEKYDLIANDRNFTLTQAAIAEGRAYFLREGAVETWFGICHGWAPAAYRAKRPQQTLEVGLEGDLKIKFYPHDLKALASQLWAKSRFPNHFIGGRCNDKEPKADENGRIIDEKCFDSNPAIWHLVLVNMVGQLQQSFVMDATFDWQVWNQPIASYKYEYFNLNSKETSKTFKESVLPISEIEKDNFAKYRSANAKYLVGIKMDLQYVGETSANHATVDDEFQDALSTVEYIYDLELDENYQIIGGEWYQNAHPDMIWTPLENFSPVTRYDQFAVTPWDAKSLLPWDWQKAAHQASRFESPLAKVIKALGM